MQKKERVAILFPGQGAQCVGMAQDFYEQSEVARRIFDDTACDFDDNITAQELCFHGPAETLRNTRYSQACIFLASMAIAETLRQYGLQADAVAGVSLGEYSALCYAGAFSVQEGVDILKERGRIMDEKIPHGTTMSAVLGLTAEELQAYCRQVSTDDDPCEIASYITPQRTVIAGTTMAIERMKEKCSGSGKRVRVIPIEVSGAFHSQLARSAADDFATVLQDYPIRRPDIPVYYNVDGKTRDSIVSDFVKIEAAQLYTSVQFVKTIESMYSDGILRYIAVGPGATMAGAVQDILQSHQDTIVQKVSTYDEISQTVGEGD